MARLAGPPTLGALPALRARASLPQPMTPHDESCAQKSPLTECRLQFVPKVPFLTEATKPSKVESGPVTAVGEQPGLRGGRSSQGLPDAWSSAMNSTENRAL